MKCFHCYKEILGVEILISADGDFVCSKKCEQEYLAEKDFFLNNVVQDESSFKEYFGLSEQDI